MNNPQLTISISQKESYSYSSGSGKNRHTVAKRDEVRLNGTNINFGDIVIPYYSGGYSIPFKIQILDHAYPTMLIDREYV